MIVGIDAGGRDVVVAIPVHLPDRVIDTGGVFSGEDGGTGQSRRLVGVEKRIAHRYHAPQRIRIGRCAIHGSVKIVFGIIGINVTAAMLRTGNCHHKRFVLVDAVVAIVWASTVATVLPKASYI